ncbi:hypothetical protein Pelo_7301 [Pelomyxa schiedti]|nr:hypothetical protein Pelo_7301 [Pelomyxa schiedti]
MSKPVHSDRSDRNESDDVSLRDAEAEDNVADEKENKGTEESNSDVDVDGDENDENGDEEEEEDEDESEKKSKNKNKNGGEGEEKGIDEDSCSKRYAARRRNTPREQWKREEEEMRESVLFSYRPRPRPQCETLLSAQDQFLAFLMASHKRCGVGSPAHVMCANTTLLKDLCDIWVNNRGTRLQKFAIIVSPQQSIGVPLGAFAHWFFECQISRALGGITLKEQFWLKLCRARKTRDFIDTTTHKDGTTSIYFEPEPYGNYGAHYRLLMTHVRADFMNDVFYKWTTNWKWWVNNVSKDNCATVAIENLFDLEPEKNRRVVTLPIKGSIIDVRFNHANVDEAYVIFNNPSDSKGDTGPESGLTTTTFAVIDLAKIHQTGELVLLSETRCSFPGKYKDSLIFRQQTGAGTYIVQSREEEKQYDTIFVVDGTTGELQNLTCGTSLDAVTNTVFQVGMQSFFTLNRNQVPVDLWNVEAEGAITPLRYVELMNPGDEEEVALLKANKKGIYVSASLAFI